MEVKSQKSRYWCFTINNPPSDLTFLEKVPKMSYIIYQLEKVSVLHVQGYIEFMYQVRFAHLKKYIPGGHYEVRKGSQQQAAGYCEKSESCVSGPFEYGTKFVPKIKKKLKLCPHCRRSVKFLFEHVSSTVSTSFYCKE